MSKFQYPSCNKFCIYLYESNQNQNHCISSSFLGGWWGGGGGGGDKGYLLLLSNFSLGWKHVWGLEQKASSHQRVGVSRRHLDSLRTSSDTTLHKNQGQWCVYLLLLNSQEKSVWEGADSVSGEFSLCLEVCILSDNFMCHEGQSLILV